MALELNELVYLTDQEKEEYMTFERGFDSPFWKKIQEMCEQRSVEALNRAAFANSWDENRVANGERVVWDFLARMSDIMEDQFHNIAEQRAMEKKARDEVDYE